MTDRIKDQGSDLHPGVQYTRVELAGVIDRAHAAIHEAEEHVNAIAEREGNYVEMYASDFVKEGLGQLKPIHDALHEGGAGLERVGCATRDPEAQAVVAEYRAMMLKPIGICGHRFEDLIGGTGSVTTCGACLAERQEQRKADGWISAKDVEIAALRAELAALTIAKPSGQPFRAVVTEEATIALNWLTGEAQPDGGLNEGLSEREHYEALAEANARRDVLLDLLSHRDHLFAQVTELQASNTALLLRGRAGDLEIAKLKAAFTVVVEAAEDAGPFGKIGALDLMKRALVASLNTTAGDPQ